MSRTRPYRRRPNAQRDVFTFIVECMDELQVAPTIREIGMGCGITSTSYISRILIELQRKDYIRQNGKARGIELLKTRWEG